MCIIGYLDNNMDHLVIIMVIYRCDFYVRAGLAFTTVCTLGAWVIIRFHGSHKSM
jgi:hypothetical protein